MADAVESLEEEKRRHEKFAEKCVSFKVRSIFFQVSVLSYWTSSFVALERSRECHVSECVFFTFCLSQKM